MLLIRKSFVRFNTDDLGFRGCRTTRFRSIGIPSAAEEDRHAAQAPIKGWKAQAKSV
jgi:hypothetical protein